MIYINRKKKKVDGKFIHIFSPRA